MLYNKGSGADLVMCSSPWHGLWPIVVGDRAGEGGPCKESVQYLLINLARLPIFSLPCPVLPWLSCSCACAAVPGLG
jgi:hypothetical protein